MTVQIVAAVLLVGLSGVALAQQAPVKGWSDPRFQPAADPPVLDVGGAISVLEAERGDVNFAPNSQRRASNGPQVPSEGHTLFVSDEYGVYFANGNFFYYTCEKADEVIRAKKLERFPNLPSLRPYSMGVFMRDREDTNSSQCLKFKRYAAQRIAMYGTANQMMIRNLGPERVSTFRPIGWRAASPTSPD